MRQRGEFHQFQVSSPESSDSFSSSFIGGVRRLCRLLELRKAEGDAVILKSSSISFSLTSLVDRLKLLSGDKTAKCGLFEGLIVSSSSSVSRRLTKLRSL